MTIKHLLIGAVCLVIAGVLLATNRLAINETTDQVIVAEGTPFEAALVVNGEAVSFETKTETSNTRTSRRKQPEDLRVSDIHDIIRSNGNTTLILADGSSMRVTPNVLKRLPSNIALSATYSEPDRTEYDGP